MCNNAAEALFFSKEEMNGERLAYEHTFGYREIGHILFLLLDKAEKGISGLVEELFGILNAAKVIPGESHCLQHGFRGVGFLIDALLLEPFISLPGDGFVVGLGCLGIGHVLLNQWFAPQRYENLLSCPRPQGGAEVDAVDRVDKLCRAGVGRFLCRCPAKVKPPSLECEEMAAVY